LLLYIRALIGTRSVFRVAPRIISTDKEATGNAYDQKDSPGEHSQHNDTFANVNGQQPCVTQRLPVTRSYLVTPSQHKHICCAANACH